MAAEIVAKLHQGPFPQHHDAEGPGQLPAEGHARRVCRWPYRVYVVCVPPAPSGGPAVLEGLGILQRTDIDKQPNNTQGWYLFSRAGAG